MYYWGGGGLQNVLHLFHYKFIPIIFSEDKEAIQKERKIFDAVQGW